MRRTVWRGGVAAVVVVVEVATCVVSGGVRGSAESPPQAAMMTVAYGGLRLPVPAGWPVYHLDAEPTRCVRYDRHAVYLGQAGQDQDCPARLVGRTEAIHIEPIHPAAAPPKGDEGEVRMTMPDAGVTVTATYGARRAAMRQIVAAARVDPLTRVRPPRRPVSEVTTRQDGAVRRRAWATGRGFDTCTAPSLRAMRAWRRAYRIANIYIGGASRACADGNLSRSWVRAVRRMGYRLIPTYVGGQAPCTRYHHRFTTKNAYRAGWLSATYAVRRAKRLGIGRRAPIYYDMEGYDSRKRWCSAAVLRFVHAWSRRMRKLRYTPGVYSSVASGIRDLGWARGVSKPSAIWFAHWDKRATTVGNKYLLSSWWRGHRRIKQYRGPHKEKHGGHTINIDSDAVDGRVY